jgi:HK97 gp10 family phage protein
MGAQAFTEGIKLDTSVLDKMTAEMKPRASAIVNTYGLAIASEAAQNAPVDTGALRNSIMSESHMENELLYIVQDGVDYGVFVEFGTSRAAAQPFFIPAVEAWRERFLAAFAGLFK